MDAADRASAAIDRAVEWTRRQRRAGWPPLSESYLAHIEHVEALPQNQSGADTSWVWRTVELARAHFRRARRVPALQCVLTPVS